MTSEQHPAEIFARFVDTFTPESRPEVLAMSGGEALLRPKLVRALAERARDAGARSSVLSGLFFASSGRIPPAIHEAIRSVDHFSVSIDAHHEQQVARADVFRVLETVMSDGIDVSVHVVGDDAEDPYIHGIVDDIRRIFDDRVPMLVNAISSFGRARAWLTRKVTRPASVEVNPCAMAAWPVVGFDGTIVACGNDDALQSVPPHLRLGHAMVDDWATIRTRSLESNMLRAIRLFGPEYIAQQFGRAEVGCSGYCGTCMELGAHPAVDERVAEVMGKPSTATLEAGVAMVVEQAGPQAFARRQGIERFAELVTLGARA